MSMMIDLSPIRQQKGRSIAFDLQSQALEGLPSDWRIIEPIRFFGVFKPQAHHLVVEGRISGTIRTRCVRCLKVLDIPIDIEVQERLLFQGDMAYVMQPDETLGDLEEQYWIFDKLAYDFNYLVLDLIKNHLPLHMVCSDDCKGLCPTCGQNLNEGSCACDTKVIDPRWAALAQLEMDEEVE